MESVRTGQLSKVTVTVMVAVPGARALTVMVSPEPLTVATPVLLELHEKEEPEGKGSPEVVLTVAWP